MKNKTDPAPVGQKSTDPDPHPWENQIQSNSKNLYIERLMKVIFLKSISGRFEPWTLA